MWDFCLDAHDSFKYFIKMCKKSPSRLWAKILVWKLRLAPIAAEMCSENLINEFMFENSQQDTMILYHPTYLFDLDAYGGISEFWCSDEMLFFY